MSSGALIIGSSHAGIQAALDLADSGIPVQLVTSSPFLTSNDSLDQAPHIIHTRLLEVVKHPQITVRTNTRLKHAKGQAGAIQIELQQQARYIDLERCTACGDCIDVCPVTVPGTDRKAIYLSKDHPPQCAVIDKQGTAPCTNACPGGIPVQGYVALIAQGRYREALDLIEAAIPFPGICGRICTHPCENNCRRLEVDGPVSIRALKRFVSDWALGQPEKDQSESVSFAADAKQVAVVGSGPAGMTVADRLSRLGHRVTIFEKLPVIGGMMGIGIPAYRLPRDVIDREYRRIQNRGVDMRLNTAIGPDGDHSIDDLFEMGFKAACLCIGAHKSLKLHIPGETLPGVVQGIDLLKAISLSQQLKDPTYQQTLSRMIRRGEVKKSARAVVLGGGNTAMDTARCLKRLGFSEVRILYRRSRAEMPALLEEIDEAEKEGILIDFLTAPVRVLGDEKIGVTGIACIRMKLAEPDASGRRRPVPISNSEFQMDVELIVPAIGQVPDVDNSYHIAINRAGRLQLQDTGFMTSRPGVFAAGDAVIQDNMAVIEAIGMGKKAALGIDAYLNGVEPGKAVKYTPCLPVIQRALSDAEKKPAPRLDVPKIYLKKRLAGFQEVETGYTEAQAKAEAKRCLNCGPCSECLACVGACKPEAVIHLQRDDIQQLTVGAIIYAKAPERFNEKLFDTPQCVYRTLPDSVLGGSFAAARAMFDLFTERRPAPLNRTAFPTAAPVRIGIFICQCGDEIARVVDTHALKQRADTWPDVSFAGELRFSCSMEGAKIINDAVRDHQLNRVVLAACSCCSLDQICYSCTYQRIRCKQNLGVFGKGLLPPAAFEFVNIREQCAWTHADDPKAATAKATALVAGAVAKARLPVDKIDIFKREKQTEPTVLVVGAGKAAISCMDGLVRQGISALHIAEIPSRVWHIRGHYAVSANGKTLEGISVVLAPRDAAQSEQFKQALGLDGQHYFQVAKDTALNIRQPGIFSCSPGVDAATAGSAAAARVAGWLGRLSRRQEYDIATIDAGRCRACHMCIKTCEIGAPVLVEENARRFAWIDPAICTGCGSCVSRCPSGAIRIGCSTDTQLAAMIGMVLQ